MYNLLFNPVVKKLPNHLCYVKNSFFLSNIIFYSISNKYNSVLDTWLKPNHTTFNQFFFKYFLFKNKNFLNFNNLTTIKSKSIFIKNSNIDFFSLLKKKKNNHFNSLIYTYTYIFLVKFLEYFLNKKIYLSFKKINFLLFKFKKNKFLIFLKKKFYRDMMFTRDKNFLKEMIEIIWITFFLKDSNFFMNWFTQKFQSISLRNHKKFLRVLKLLLVRYYNFFFRNTNVLGFFFDIRGKVGVAGNAKKRHVSIFSGLYSSTNKNLKINSVQSNVKTTTGLLGVTFCLFF